MESVEHYCKIMYYLNQIGSPQEFNCGQVSELIDIRKKIGINSGGVPPCELVTEKEKDDKEELIKSITKKVIDQLK